MNSTISTVLYFIFLSLQNCLLTIFIGNVTNVNSTEMEKNILQNFYSDNDNENDNQQNLKDWPRKIRESKNSRNRRDGGFITGFGTAVVSGVIERYERDVLDDTEPVFGAVLNGIIGMTAKAVSDITAYRPLPSNGGCMWFGTAPFCNHHCPPEYDYIRSSNGRCSSKWFASVCKPDPSFGYPCSTVLGNYFTKRFCCKSDPTQCAWSGRWMSANTAHNVYCRYDNNFGKCGSLDCAVNHYDYQAHNSTEIFGSKCDQINLFGYNGKATCGYISWFDKNGQIVDSWYKTK